MKIHMIFFVFILILFSCNNEKECPPCENGGICVDGTCVCVGLWTGKNCDQQVMPAYMFVDRIVLHDMPATDNGAGWDITSGPDVYIIIKQGEKTVYSSQASPVINGAEGASWSGQINITDVQTPVEIQLWDADDFDADDYMGGIVSQLYHDKNGFPENIDIDCGACVVAFRLQDITYL